jgi:hypothetical protein
VSEFLAVVREDLPEGKQLPEGAVDTIPAALIAAEEEANRVLADGLKLHFVKVAE